MLVVAVVIVCFSHVALEVGKKNGKDRKLEREENWGTREKRVRIHLNTGKKVPVNPRYWMILGPGAPVSD